MSDINSNYERIKTNLKTKIAEAKYVCTTADIWTNKSRSFLGVTIHFFDNNLERKSYLLAFRRIMGRHTHSALGEILLGVHKEFDIKRKIITHVVTDGGSNFKKAFIIYGEDDKVEENDLRKDDNEPDLDDDQELEIEDALDGDDCMYFPPETITESITLSAPQSNDFDEDDDDDFSVLPKQMRCVAHSLNLLGTKDF